MKRAIQGIAEYPILGIGVRNFEVYSTVWRDVHMTYLQIAVEGGIPSLILYLLFFGRGFSNLRGLLRRKNLDARTTLFVEDPQFDDRVRRWCVVLAGGLSVLSLFRSRLHIGSSRDLAGTRPSIGPGPRPDRAVPVFDIRQTYAGCGHNPAVRSEHGFLPRFQKSRRRETRKD